MATTKADPKKDLDSYPARAGEFRTLNVPPLRYLMIDGAGDPNTAIEKVAGKGVPLLDALRIETLVEGTCAQTLHLGPYDDEGPVLGTMHESFLPAPGLRPTGKHHEVYFSDPRRTGPARLRTILRQPVEAC